MLDVICSALYDRFVIKTFRCRETERLYQERVSSKRFRSFGDVAYRKLFQLAHAKELRDLQQAPGNRLEKLSGNRQRTYSIRINDQWRICFTWNEGAAYDVEIIDYHQ
jgi:toxin HigB-1